MREIKMNNYFIKECDCKEIQGLRKKLKYGDWILLDNLHTLVNLSSCGDCYVELDNFNIAPIEKRYTWLPTGDQLDEEIMKICKKSKLVYKVIHYSNDIIKAFIYNSDNKNGEPIYTKRVEFQISDVCLIAKIRILKQLLK